MFRHLLKLIWKRKGRNLMLSLEIVLAFVIVFAIAAFGTRMLQLYRLPLGFSYDNVWSVGIALGEDGMRKPDMVLNERMVRAMKELPEVEAVSFSTFSPFVSATMRTELANPVTGKAERSDMMVVDDAFQSAAGVLLREGRWFSELDNGAHGLPVVINRRLATTLFGAQSALGQSFYESGDRKKHDLYRVVGVMEDFRNKGELMSPVNFVFKRFTPVTHPFQLGSLVLKVKPGTERQFEMKLNRQLKAVKNDWSYEISPLSSLRASMLRSDLIPLAICAVIAAFMLAMVAFGLFGVLWQNTTRRIPEIGLRRAIGASAASIYRHIIAEQLMLSSLAMLVGLVLLVQLPLTGALGDSLGWPVFAGATVLSMAVIYLLSLLCSLYPGWRASRLSPTEALHYE